MTWEQVSASSNVTYSGWIANEVVSELARRNDPEAGSAGVREPRRPVQPRNTSGAALALPHADEDDAGRVKGVR